MTPNRQLNARKPGRPWPAKATGEWARQALARDWPTYAFVAAEVKRLGGERGARTRAYAAAAAKFEVDETTVRTRCRRAQEAAPLWKSAVMHASRAVFAKATDTDHRRLAKFTAWELAYFERAGVGIDLLDSIASRLPDLNSRRSKK